MDTKGPEKKARLLAALDRGMVMIHLDARRPGVIVPPALRAEAYLQLNLSYRFERPDLTVGEWGIRSTLSFSGSRFTVAVPWSALFAITSHVTKERWVYPEDMPAEFLQQTQVTSKVPQTEAAVAQPPPAPAERPRGGFLREVPVQPPEEAPAPVEAPTPVAAAAVEPPPQPEGPKDEPPAPRRGHLRLVK
jgi:stringent starvation protein B